MEERSVELMLDTGKKARRMITWGFFIAPKESWFPRTFLVASTD
jgi:hypothetical protein